MAKVTIYDIKPTKRELRKMFRQANLQYRFAYGQHVICQWPRYKDTKTPRQLQCRERFKKAQQYMLEEFADPQQVEYWKEVAPKFGFKTAKGCCKSYYMALLREVDEALEDPKREKVAIIYTHDVLYPAALYSIDYAEDNNIEDKRKVMRKEMTLEEFNERAAARRAKRVPRYPLPKDWFDEEEGEKHRWKFLFYDKKPYTKYIDCYCYPPG
jgi:uncharacterized protein YdiU (UPF0061 family)